MNTKEYIESGILELYVFGKLSPQEEREVEKNADQYPDIKEEISNIEIAFEQYALSKGVLPPPGTLTSILRQAGQMPTGATSAGSSAIVNYLLAGLSAIALLGTYYFYSQSNEKEATINQQVAKLETLTEDCNQIKAENEQLFTQIEILLDPEYRSIPMSATGKYESSGSGAKVLYNTEEETAWLETRNLPAPPTGKQYQLWAIVNGKPVDMGVFDLGLERDTLLQKVPFIAAAQAFAVTIENAGGVASPTLEEMIVVGNVG